MKSDESMRGPNKKQQNLRGAIGKGDEGTDGEASRRKRSMKVLAQGGNECEHGVEACGRKVQGGQ